MTICLLALVLLVGEASGPLWAQDRGAPRFGPTDPRDTIEAESSDAGRLWSVAAPPFSRFEARYGMEADSGWVTHLRRGILRLPGCTAALVSGDGLALTTAHCVRRHTESEGAEGTVLATESSAERPVPDLHVDRLLRASDVTAAVRSASAGPDTSVVQARKAVRERLQSEAGASRRVEVNTAAGRARHTAYVYRRYDDVRLAFLPEQALSAFGGTDAVLTYPRSALDVALLRVYTAEGTPLAPTHFFDPSSQGVRPGDPVFSVGHSQKTRRVETTEQLAFRRDVVLPRRRALLHAWTDAVEAVLDTMEASAARWKTGLSDGRRALKKTRARLEALGNEYVMTRLEQRDTQLREVLQRNPDLQRRFGGLMDSLAALQEKKRSLGAAYRAFGGLEGGPYHSSTLRRALLVHGASTGPASQRDSVWQRAVEVPEQPSPVDAAVLATRLEALRAYLATDTAAVRRVLKGHAPGERAASVVETSVLSHPEGLRALREQDAIVADDPALALVEAVLPDYRSFRDEWRALKQSERTMTRRLARARAKGSTVPLLPARTGAPRLTDGRLLGYPYNGTTAPPFTTLHGLYSRNRSFEGAGAWRLPEPWTPSAEGLDRSVPLNVAVSTDGAAGTDGAPLLNRYLEIVGVAFDTNIQGVAGSYLFLPERMRSVAVDLRGLRQVLTNVYDAETLADELFGGTADAGETP